MRVQLRSVFAGLILSVALKMAAQADWRRAPSPLKTRWAANVSPTNAHPEYPRPQMVRKEWLNLNGLWDYAITARDVKATDSFEGSILVPFPVESSLSGVARSITYGQRLWYRRSFTLPASWKGRDVLLHFGAVDYETVVWLNGTRLGEHRGGYDAFSFDITSALKPSQTNEMIVAVWDPTNDGPFPRGKQSRLRENWTFYSPCSGIWQTVWLEPVPRSRIAGVRISPDLGRRTFRLKVVGENCAPAQTVRSTLNVEGSAIAHEIGVIGDELPIVVPEPRLWSPEDPFLYDLRVDLMDGTNVVDSVKSYAGMRQVSLERNEQGRPRIFLNGRPYFMLGVLDESYWPDGLYTPPTDEAIRWEIESIRKLGFNMIRKHVKVESDRWYYWTDKLGVLVWQDMPSGDRTIEQDGGDFGRSAQSAQAFERELQAMVEGRFDHPSIILWSLFNQGWGQYATVRLTQRLKELDSTRLTVSVSGWVDRGVGDIKSVHHYPAPLEILADERRALAYGEIGGLGLLVAGHSWGTNIASHLPMPSKIVLEQQYQAVMEDLVACSLKSGVSAAVYTQTTDVELEGDGLWTYDREVLKMDPEVIRQTNRRTLSRLQQTGALPNR